MIISYGTVKKANLGYPYIPFVGESSNFDESAGVVNVGICRFENKQVFLMHTELS